MRSTISRFRVALALPFVAGLALLCPAGDGTKEANELKWEKLPKAVQSGMQKVIMEHLLKGETVKVGAFEDQGDGVYEAETTIDGKAFDFYVDKDGNFAGVEDMEEEEATENVSDESDESDACGECEEGDECGECEEGDEADEEVPATGGAFLGIQLGEGRGKGVVVGGVLEDGPAAKAGLAAKDVIQTIGETKIQAGEDGIRQLLSALSKLKPGDKVKLGVLHDGKPKELTVTLGERPEMEDSEGDEAGESDEEGDGDEAGEEEDGE